MYLRFITQFVNPYGENETGIFMSLKFLRDDYRLTTDEDVYKLKVLTGWFNDFLDKPAKFSNAKNKNPESISLSWFKDSAKEHIQKMQELIEILERYDFVVDRLNTKNPGYIIYEDDYQVSAIPFKSDRNKVV
jgi:hypothetical protein